MKIFFAVFVLATSVACSENGRIETPDRSEVMSPSLASGYFDCELLEGALNATEHEDIVTQLDTFKYLDLESSSEDCVTQQYDEIRDTDEVNMREIKLLLAQLAYLSFPEKNEDKLQYAELSMLDSESSVRALAAQIIGFIGNEEHADMLGRMVAEDEVDVSIKAAVALWGIARESTIARDVLGKSIARIENNTTRTYVNSVVSSLEGMQP